MNEITQFRQKIMTLEHAIKQMPQLQEELHHHFADGVYAREMRVPAGTLLVGKIHRLSCVNFIMKGVVEVRAQEGAFRVEAPYVFVSPAGTKRAMFALTDLTWVTVHPASTTDLALLEQNLILDDFDSLPRAMVENDL